MRALLILAFLLTACETTWQVHQGPNQAPELTATRRVFTFYMFKTSRQHKKPNQSLQPIADRLPTRAEAAGMSE
jgi:hypothetical protein